MELRTVLGPAGGYLSVHPAPSTPYPVQEPAAASLRACWVICHGWRRPARLDRPSEPVANPRR